MMWLWLPLVWLLVSAVVGVWLGTLLRTADRNDEVRVEVDRALRADVVPL